MPQVFPQLFITTGDVLVIARSFPALQTLTLSGQGEAVLYQQQECELQPLSQLTGLTHLSIAARRDFASATLASLSSLQQLPSLELQLLDEKERGRPGGFHRVFPHLSSLWGLPHLTRLSCAHVNAAPPHIARFRMGEEEHVELELDDDNYDGVLTMLAGCRQLTSLHLPWANFIKDRAAERLAAALPQLTQLSVKRLRPEGAMPPCSWRELTLCGEYQELTTDGLFELPLEGLDHLRLNHLVCAHVFSGGLMGDFINMMEQRGPLLAAKLQAANNGRGIPLSFRSCLGSAQIARGIASLAALDGAVDAMHFSLRTLLEGAHVQALATSLPRLAHLSVSDPGLIGDDAWACIGTLPSLEAFSAIDGAFAFRLCKEPFNPRHMALLASSVTRPLTVTVAQSDAGVAVAALRALQAAGNVGAGFITLLPREA